MVEDLLCHHKLLNKSRSEIISILGQPDEITDLGVDSYVVQSGKCGNAGTMHLDFDYRDYNLKRFRVASYTRQPAVGTTGLWDYH
jgi:hypothetical protein